MASNQFSLSCGEMDETVVVPKRSRCEAAGDGWSRRDARVPAELELFLEGV